MQNSSKTDWKKLSDQDDSNIDTSDIPELNDSFFNDAVIRIPAKKPITIRLDEDILEWFKSQGKGYQTKINKLLRTYMESQQKKAT